MVAATISKTLLTARPHSIFGIVMTWVTRDDTLILLSPTIENSRANCKNDNLV